jgi:hypothetical protein
MPHRLLRIVFVLFLPLALIPAATQAATACGLTNPAFCETFDAPAGTGNRSGQLNGTLWGVSRTSGANNAGQGSFNTWFPTTVQSCSGNVAGQPDATDILICNGQVREATTDGGNVTTLAMYPKQPFDFAGRTGKVTFDVSNDTQGAHAAWPEFWISDQPVPAPFTHEATWIAAPRNGLGIRFAGFTNQQGQAASCPEGSPQYVGANEVITVSNYVVNDQAAGGNVRALGSDCVKTSTGPGQFNHYEVDVSQSQIQVFGTDAGTTAPLKLLSTAAVNLTFTRGLIWIEDAHYNGNKFNSQGTHTFSWDNVGFDGPVVNRDLTYDVPDALQPGGGGINLAWNQGANQPQTKTVTGVANVAQAAAALLTFDFSPNAIPTVFTYSVNGHSHTQQWPYPDTVGSSWRTLALSVPLTDVLTGNNTISVASDQGMLVANMDLVLAGAGGGAGSPTATPVPTSTAQPTSTPTAIPPTSTPVPTATSVPTDQPTATAVPTSTSVPTAVPTAVPTVTLEPVPTSTPAPMSQSCTIQIASDGTVTGTCQPVP